MSSNPDRRRRLVLLGMAGAFAAGPAVASGLLRTTPRQPAGPFYPVKLPLDDDNDLTRVRGKTGVANGRLTDLSGRILDANGRPMAGLRVEIWQCDANGRYRHPGDWGRAALDPNFQGHGHTTTDEAGRYRFRTIRPVPYPGRTPHIHVAVLPAGEQPFVSQIYVKGEARNGEDFLFNRIPVERRHLVLASFFPSAGHEVELDATFDIILAGAGGTPTA